MPQSAQKIRNENFGERLKYNNKKKVEMNNHTTKYKMQKIAGKKIPDAHHQNQNSAKSP